MIFVFQNPIDDGIKSANAIINTSTLCFTSFRVTLIINTPHCLFPDVIPVHDFRVWKLLTSGQFFYFKTYISTKLTVGQYYFDRWSIFVYYIYMMSVSLILYVKNVSSRRVIADVMCYYGIGCFACSTDTGLRRYVWEK